MNGLLVGRFQPFHLGHLYAIDFALSKVDELFLCIGSSNKTNEEKNPFSAIERKEMILSSLTDTMKKHVLIYFIEDKDDHQKWIESISEIVPQFDLIFTNDEMTRNMYQNLGVKTMEIPFINRENLSGTIIRRLIKSNQAINSLVPSGARTILERLGAKDRLLDL